MVGTIPRTRHPAFFDFWTATRESPTLVGLVEDIDIAAYFDEDDAFTEERNSLFDFLKSATNLKSLTVSGDTAPILSARFAISCFPRLESLDIDCRQDRYELRYLPFLPMLKSVLVWVSDAPDWNSTGRLLADDRLALQLADVPERTGIESLAISGPLDNTARFVTLVSQSQSLRSLKIDLNGEDEIFDLRPVLRVVNADRLRELSITLSNDTPVPSKLHESIPRFTSLSSITLHVDFCTQLVAQSITQLPVIKSIAVVVQNNHPPRPYSTPSPLFPRHPSPRNPS